MTAITASHLIENAIGGSGRDRLIGNQADNELTGNGRADKLSGRAGADHLLGGSGSDTLWGGLDADVFVFTALSDSRVGKHRDVIKDFSTAQGDQDRSEGARRRDRDQLSLHRREQFQRRRRHALCKERSQHRCRWRRPRRFSNQGRRPPFGSRLPLEPVSPTYRCLTLTATARVSSTTTLSPGLMAFSPGTDGSTLTT